MRKLLLLVFLFPSSLFATTYYVSTTGNNNNSCAAAQNPLTAKRNIVSGTLCLAAGDTLILRAGTYTDPVSDRFDTSNFPGGSSGIPTIIQCETFRTCIVQPSSNPPAQTLIRFDKSWIEFHDFILDGVNTTSSVPTVSPIPLGNAVKADQQSGSQTTNVSLIGVEIKNMPWEAIQAGQSDNFTLSGVSIHDIVGNAVPSCGPPFPCTGSSPNGGYGCYCGGANLTINNSEFYNIIGYAITTYPNGASGTVSNNTFHDNGVGLTTGDSGTVKICEWDVDILSGVYVLYNNIVYNSPSGGLHARNAASSTIMYGNTIYNSNTGVFDCIYPGGPHPPGAGITTSAAGSNMRNNLLLNNGANGILVYGGGSGTFTNNLCDAMGAGNCQFASTAAVEFVSASMANFHLLSGAIARNNAVNLGSPYTPDKDGVARPSPPTLWDVGPYQFVSPNNVPVFAMNSFRRSR